MSEFVVDIADNVDAKSMPLVKHNEDRHTIRKKLASEFKARGLPKVYVDYAEESAHVQYSGGRYTRIRNSKRQLQHSEMVAPKEISYTRIDSYIMDSHTPQLEDSEVEIEGGADGVFISPIDNFEGFF